MRRDSTPGRNKLIGDVGIVPTPGGLLPADTWDSTAEDLARARRELATMERAPSEGRVADEQAWLDAVANKRKWIAKLEEGNTERADRTAGFWVAG